MFASLQGSESTWICAFVRVGSSHCLTPVSCNQQVLNDSLWNVCMGGPFPTKSTLPHT